MAGDVSNEWTISDVGQGVLNSITFSGFENLVGGSADDRFVFGRRGGLTGKVDGGAGNNTLDLSANWSTTNLRIDDVFPMAGAVNGFALANVVEVRASERFGGTVTGPVQGVVGNAPLTWVINQQEAFIDFNIHLLSFDTFVGSSGDDLFSFAPVLI